MFLSGYFPQLLVSVELSNDSIILDQGPANSSPEARSGLQPALHGPWAKNDFHIF